jgi:hypothetical protein
MNQPDDLEQLWKTQPVETAIKGEQMRQIILKNTEKFDRTIHRRNIREVIAAFVVAVVFGYQVWGQQNGIARLGNVILVGASLWIIYYLWRHGTAPADPNPDQSIAGYQRALVSKIDHQIRLARSVKFWYLLPMYVGLLTLSAGWLHDSAGVQALTWRDGIFPLIYTLLFAGVWWLNEVYAVRKLEQRRMRLTSAVQQEESPC